MQPVFHTWSKNDCQSTQDGLNYKLSIPLDSVCTRVPYQPFLDRILSNTNRHRQFPVQLGKRTLKTVKFEVAFFGASLSSSNF